MYQPQPQPFYGWIRNQVTGDRIGPATRDQWDRYTSLHPDAYPTIEDSEGRVAYLTDHPERLACGHAAHEHLGDFGRGVLRAAELVIAGMDDPDDDDPESPILIDLGDGLNRIERAALLSVACKLLIEWDTPAGGIMETLIAEGRPLAGLALGHIVACTLHGVPLHRNLIKLVSIMDDDDLAAVIACGAAAADGLKWSPDQVRDLVRDTLYGGDDDRR
jgi:hypothetical protein